MGNERAIILTGTMLASVILVIGVMFALPTTVETKTQNSAMAVMGHWEIVVTNPDGTAHYSQADNFPTDWVKNEAFDAIFEGTLKSANSMDWIGLGNDDGGATGADATALVTELTASGRCQDATPTNTQASSGGAASSVVSCDITIDATDDNDTVIEVALFDAATAGNMGSVSTLTPSVLVQTGTVVTSTVTFTIS